MYTHTHTRAHVGFIDQLPPHGELWITQYPNLIGIVAEIGGQLPFAMCRSPDCGGSSLALVLQAKVYKLFLCTKNMTGETYLPLSQQNPSCHKASKANYKHLR